MAEETRQSVSASRKMSSPGPFLAKIISHLDPMYMGSLEVQLLHEVGNDEAKSGQLHIVKYLTPFAGQTSVEYLGEDPNDYNNTQKAYGMWMVPPDVGTVVVVIFIDGDSSKGYWIGCVQDNVMNFSVPGHAATVFHEGGIDERVPVAEYNKKTQPPVIDPTYIAKPPSPLQDVLKTQGLLRDDIRGITTSSARREIPSSVFGISTPGPIDKRPGAKKGKIGKAEHKIAAGFVSRLGGTTFVMDDGDDKFLRKTRAYEGPPDYAAVEQDETDGLPDVPHNELFRIRTRTGHQILFHNSEDLIYIGNARGTTWIELTSNGKIDIYAKDSVSIHTENDLNVTADRDINLTAGRNINLNAGKNFNATAAENYEIKAGTDGKLTVGGTSHINAGAEHRETAGKINMNGPGAAEAVVAPKALRVPQHEPWSGHENLNPTGTVPGNTEATTEAPESTAPSFFNKYTTVTDTFAKIKGAEE